MEIMSGERAVDMLLFLCFIVGNAERTKTLYHHSLLMAGIIGWLIGSALWFAMGIALAFGWNALMNLLPFLLNLLLWPLVIVLGLIWFFLWLIATVELIKG